MKKQTFFNFILIAIAIVIVAVPMLMPDLNIYADEGAHNVARALGIKVNGLSVFNKIVPSFANQFGYSWALFEGNLAYALLSIFVSPYESVVLEYKVFEFLLLIASAVTMYLLIKSISKDKKMATLASIIYIMLPYHLTSMYVTNSIVDQLIFVLMPLVFMGAQYLINGSKWHLIYPVALVLLFLTNIPIGYIVAVLSFLYVLINYKSLKENKCRYRLWLDIVFVLFITSFDWLARLQAQMWANYKINNITDGEFQTFVGNSISIRKLFVTAKNEKYVFELGPMLIAMFAVMPMAITTITKKYLKNYLFFLLMSVGLMFCATNVFPWANMPHWVVKLGSPYKLLSVATFFFVVVCSLNVGAVIDKLKIKHIAVLLIVNAISIALLAGYIQRANINSIVTNVGQITGKQDEIQAGLNKLEYLPMDAYNNKFYIATRSREIIALEGKAIIESTDTGDYTIKAKVQTFDEVTLLELPYIYYPGYVVKGDGVTMKAFETRNGFLGVELPKNDTINLEVSYSETPEIKLAKGISIAFAVLFIGYCGFEIFKKKVKTNSEP